MNKLVVGCGYLGTPVAEKWLRDGHRVHVLTRSAEHAELFSRQGMSPILGDITVPETLVDLPEVEHVLCAVGYDRRAGLSINTVYVEGLTHLLDALSTKTARLIYVSSTGVYGQNDGAWIDENSPCLPVRAGGVACLEAERRLQNHVIGRRSVILRMCGIYGPGRVPRIADIKAGRPIMSPEDGYLNLIHREDAVRSILLAEENAVPPDLILVGDGCPVLRRDYFSYLAQLLETDLPDFETPQQGAAVSARALSDKRVTNRKMLDILQIRLEYPSFREGLASIVALDSRD